MSRRSHLSIFASLCLLCGSINVLTSNTTVLAADLEPAQQTPYQEWLNLLTREAKRAEAQQPKQLTVMLGDSLTQSFPWNLLPQSRTWLNQGISGETSTGLLRRLSLLDQTQPEVILVMIGINDLLQGKTDEQILANHQQILRYLQRVHPQSQVIVQSILPHVGSAKVSNSRIRGINRALNAIALREGARYLDLYSRFSDDNGNLRSQFSSDGLHLSRRGYEVWVAEVSGFLAPE